MLSFSLPLRSLATSLSPGAQQVRPDHRLAVVTASHAAGADRMAHGAGLATAAEVGCRPPLTSHEDLPSPGSRQAMNRTPRPWLPLIVGSVVSAILAGCGKAPESASTPVAQAETKPKLGIRPLGDETVKIDMSRVYNPDLAKVFDHIDQNIDDHVEFLQKWVRQPSISNTGEGMQESAEMVKGFFDQLGCQESKVYDVGITEWGQQGNPVVYAKCDEGAEKTLVVYWMYDTMPVTQPDLWKSPPFEARLIEQEPYKKVLVGRGANNSKGRQASFYNAVMSMKAVTGKLPVNLIFVAEGDEERMSMGYRKFVREHKELFEGADSMWALGAGGGSEGCVFVELITSGEKWGRGPNYSDIHGGNKRSVDSPAWRHIKMLSTLVDDTGNKVLIDGFYDDIAPLTKEEEKVLRTAAEKVNLETAAKNLGVARFIADDPYTYLKMQRAGTSMNLDGIWGGNMFVAKLRKHLDKHGYKDVEINVVGDVPWAKMGSDSELDKAVEAMHDAFGVPLPVGVPHESILGGYWPAYLFAGDVLDIPIAGGNVGSGGHSHAANEFYVIEGAGKTYGMAGAEKSVAMALYNYAGRNAPAK
jgi:acetylornithine deacetylase/succinyl-diaminopimelate desuccinylase-like protein